MPNIKSIPSLFHKQLFWQLILSLLMIGMAIFFIKNENIEFVTIKNKFSSLNLFFVFIGSLFTLLYIFLQGLMYVYSFKALYVTITIKKAIILFLKRNLLSVFLPAGGLSSLAFFSKDVENKRITSTQVYLSSGLFGITGILSVLIIGLPGLYYALLKGLLHATEIVAFVFISILSIFLLVTIVSLLKKGSVYRFIKQKKPKWVFVMDEFSTHRFSKKHLLNTLVVSLGVDAIGIAHLYIAMLALGFTPSLPAAILGYIVMVILLIASPLLRGLGAIEISVTYLLKQYGFSLIEAAAITLLFRLFEFWLPLFISVASFFSSKNNLVLRVLPAVLIFITGIVNVISAITPALPKRLHALKNFLPVDFILVSHALVLISGLLLIIIAVFLIQGSKRAWYTAIILTAISAIGHLSKAIDYEEALFTGFVFLILYITRTHYRLKPNPFYTKLSLKVILYGLIAILLYGILGFYFMDKHHFGIDFKFLQSIQITGKLFFLFNDSGLKPHTHFGHFFIDSFYWAGSCYILFIAVGLFIPYFKKPYNTEEEVTLVNTLVKKYGHSSLDYFKVYPDKLFYITPKKNAFISFKMAKNIALVLEDPVGENEEAVKNAIVNFDAYCREYGFAALYYRVPKESLRIYKSLNKKSFPIGEEAIVNLDTFTLEGKKMKAMRNSVSHFTKNGFICQTYHPPIEEEILQKLEAVSQQWLHTLGQSELVFTEGTFDPHILRDQTILTVEDLAGRVYAFLNLIPSFKAHEGSYDLIRKTSDAPNGVLDFLLVNTIRYLKDQGFQELNMGLTQLTGIEGINLKERTVKFAYENLKTFDRFKNLRKYKEKFNPFWQKKYLVYDDSYYLLQVPHALRKVSENHPPKLP